MTIPLSCGTTKASPSFRRGRMRRGVDFMLWAYTPFRPMNTSSFYDLVAMNGFTENGLYLNLGYWQEAQTIDQACEAMASLVAETAEMGPGMDVVDVGFGFAEQDMLWVDRFAPGHITGLNVNPSQVRTARWRVRSRGMSDRIELLQGSATDIPLPSTGCDIVTALECAFHFDTRQDFFAEAFRILRPGGRLVIADIIRSEPAEARESGLQDLVWSTFANKFAVPPENEDGRDGYLQKLRHSGFSEVHIRSISDQVFPGWHRALRDDPQLLRRLPLAGRLPYWLLCNVSANRIYGALDYVVVAARKSRGPSRLREE